jgi:hypothetical protein
MRAADAPPVRLFGSDLGVDRHVGVRQLLQTAAAEVYVLSLANTNSCPANTMQIIYSNSYRPKCNAAAVQFATCATQPCTARTSQDPSKPKGCYLESTDNTVYFNSELSNSASPTATPICSTPSASLPRPPRAPPAIRRLGCLGLSSRRLCLSQSRSPAMRLPRRRRPRRPLPAQRQGRRRCRRFVRAQAQRSLTRANTLTTAIATFLCTARQATTPTAARSRRRRGRRRPERRGRRPTTLLLIACTWSAWAASGAGTAPPPTR